MEEEITKADLMQRISDSREALERLVAGLDEMQLSRPGADGGWAIKDHLFHLATWELGVARLLARQSRYEGMGISAQEYREMETDEVNDLIYRRNRERPAAEALVAFRDAHREMLDALAPLGDADLLRPYADFDVVAGLFPDRPIIGWITGDTFNHFDEHLDYIRTLLAEQRPPPH